MLVVLLTSFGCNPPPDPTITPLTYVGVWRAGTSKADFKLFELYKDKTIKLFGTKHDLMAPVDLVGDDMTVKPDGKANPEEGGTKYQLHLKRISDKQIEIIDDSGVILGDTTPVTFDKASSDQEEEANSAILSRAMNGG